MDDNMLPELGDLLFSLFIGYVGALEFLYVVRHLYHWSCDHANSQQNANEPNSLKNLQDTMRLQLSEAEQLENAAGGMNAMQDGVLYQDGFRIDAQQQEIDDFKEQQRAKEAQRQALAAELARQKQIEEDTRKQLAEAEAKLEQQRRKAAEQAEEEEARKLAEAERAKEAEQRKREEEAEAAENVRKLLEAERQREEEQRRREEEERESEENARKLLEMESQNEAQQRQKEAEEEEAANNSNEFLDIERQMIEAESDEGEALKNVERERKQKLIAENARKFLEAEQEMLDLMLEAAQQKQQQQTLQQQASKTESMDDFDGMLPVVEEPCIRRTIAPLTDDQERLTQTLKTQFGQTAGEPYALPAKSLTFSLSDDGSSIEPNSSQKSSSFSTQASDDVTLEFAQTERQEPDGEDHVPDMLQYSEDYLRSLDGIKQKPLVREDGTGRRRAFKKRRSSASSTSSRDSREEEVKMFTSLEEQELHDNNKQTETDYAPVKYASFDANTLRVKTPQHRRHKRSPAKDVPDEKLHGGALEMLDEEENSNNPWGELLPEPYKNSEIWKRGKALSIDEEDLELERTAELQQEILNKLSETLSTEDEEAANNNMQQVEEIEQQLEQESTDHKDNENTNNVARSSSSPRLRRSPRIDIMPEYEDRWKEQAESESAQPSAIATAAAPTINIQHAEDTAPWRDEHGLLMQGLSDFYDFTASVNPSRSRSNSRNPSPARTTNALPKNVCYSNANEDQPTGVDVYDDSDLHIKQK